MIAPARRSWLILSIFILSGAAALIDEIVWSRQLVLVFGNTTQAVSAILAGFFGGIAVGSYVGGRIADRVRSPLRMYGVLELILAVVVVITPFSFRLINELYRGVYPSLEGSPQLLAFVRIVLAVLALAPATVLMGATLPTLTRYLARDASLAGAFSRLYAANTIGAILGTLVAGFVLIELLGLSGALVVGAGCSAVAGLAALWLARSSGTCCDVVVAPPPIRRSARRPASSALATLLPAPRAHGGVHLGPDLARLPGRLDAAPGVRDRQHDLRVHDHPRDVPDRDRHRRGALRTSSDRGSATRSGSSPPARSSQPPSP